jgi:hypothetical protein
MQLQVALEDPGTTGPDGPAFHQRGGAQSECRKYRRGFFYLLHGSPAS